MLIYFIHQIQLICGMYCIYNLDLQQERPRNHQTVSSSYSFLLLLLLILIIIIIIIIISYLVLRSP